MKPHDKQSEHVPIDMKAEAIKLTERTRQSKEAIDREVQAHRERTGQ